MIFVIYEHYISMWKETLSNIFTAVLVTCALLITGLVIHRHFFVGSSSGGARYVEDWQSLAASGHRLGPQDASVEIVVFFDYQCPYCDQSMATLDTIRQRYPDRVAVILRHLPLPSHPQAGPAAHASECAAQQGQFRSYHTILFANRVRLDNIAWDSLAVEAGVQDLDAFRTCMSKGKADGRIQRDIRAAQELVIRSVPTFVVNGHLFSGAPPTEMLDRLVQDTLDRVG